MDPFVSNAENCYHLSTFSVDFSDKDTEKAMAKWISENTNGTLTPNLEINPTQTLSIINTIYFCDEWVNDFNKESTEKEAFHAEKGDVKAEFMHKTGTMDFVIGENYMRSSLDLKGDGQMILNRLFIYGITSSNGTLIFVGVCNNPSV